MRATAGRPALLTLEVDDADGVPTNADEDTDVTLQITAGDGTTVIEADAVADDVDTVGLYTYALAPQVRLDVLEVIWSATVDGVTQTTQDEVRIVGTRLLSPGDIRRDPNLLKLTHDPDGRRVLAEVVDAVEDLFADALGFPATLEGIRVNWDAHRGTVSEGYAYGTQQGGPFAGTPGLGLGFGGERLLVPGVSKPQELYFASVNGAVLSDTYLEQITPGNGFFVWQGGVSWPSGNYTMWLSHGWRTPPGDIRWAAAKLAGYVAKRTPSAEKGQPNLPERTASLTTDGGTIVFAVPTADRPTGLPEVDAVLFRYASEDVL